MDTEQEIKILRERLKKLSASKYRRFNVLLKKEAFVKLEEEAKKQGKSKAGMLGEVIKKYNN